MNKIAVLTNEKGRITSFDNEGILKVFHMEKGQWILEDEIEIEAPRQYSIEEEKKQFQHIIDDLDDCNVIIVKKIEGIPYDAFRKAKFSIWELEGRPKDHLDYVLKNKLIN